MISVEKRRSSRKSGKHRKRSDTSSGGSFLDENDREVSSLTDRAFKSLCIGDEAVYNDSHLGLPSSSTHIDRQLAFAQDEPFRDEEEREELKRAAHQNFSLRVQQYGQDWVHEGMYGTSTHKDPEWGVYGDRTQGRVSATFQNSFVETSQQGMSLREEELSFISNGATELSLQHHRSRSRVSSLIRTFNSEVKRNGANMNDQFRGCNEETNWDKSALINIHNEFSDFSSSYQPNLNSSSNFPSAGPFSCRDDNFYGSDRAAVAQMSHNSVSSFMRSSHNELSMSAQANCNSPFFIHSEFSPFKVWREHNRFPFQQREVSGFMHCSQFPKWYETPMYKELSLENQLQGPYRGMRHSSSNLAPRAPSNPSHFTSMSLMQQKASAVEKRSESELAGHYPQRRRTQTLGTNKLPCQRPSTASPTIEMSRRVRDTISSVKALQQKIKVMSQQNISAGVITTQQESFRNHNLFHYGNNAAPNMVSSDISTTPFTISQLPTPSVTAHQEENTSGFQQHEASPQPVEHPPVRAESRGVTPDARLSSYKSRATSLLFNLKDNRKRVKSTYSPTKFKGLDKQEKNQQPPIQEPKETVIDVPDCLDPDIQFLQQENSRSTIMAANQYKNPALTIETQLERVNTGQYLENTSTDYQTAQVQGEMVCHSGFSGFISGNYTSNQLTNGQNRHEYLASFTPYKQGGRDNSQLQEGLQHPHAAADTTRLNIDRSQSKDSLIRTAEAEQALNEPIGKVITERGRYENFQDEINTSSNGKWQNCKDTEKVSLKAAASPLKQNPVHLMERQENQRNVQKATENVEAKDSFGSSSYKSVSSVSNNFSHKSNAKKEQNVDMRDDVALHYNTHTNKDPKRPNQLNPTTDNAKLNAAQIKTFTSLMTEDEKQSLQLPKSKNAGQEKSSVCTDNASEFMMANQMNHEEFDGVKGEQAMAENKRVKHGKAQMAAAQQRADAEQPKAESSRLILTGQTESETDKTDSKAEATKAETLKQECMKKEESNGELKEDEREKHPEKSMGQHTAVKTKDWMSTDESTGVLGKDEDTEGKQVKHSKREQEETEKPEEKQKLTQMAAIERIKECRTAQETDKTNNPEQAETERLRKAQAASGLIETEQVKTEKIQVEEAESKCKTTEKTEQTDDQNKQTKTEEEEGGRMTHVVASKTEKDSTLSRQGNAEKSTTCDFKDTKPEERKAEQLKQEERKVELSKAELLKTENLLEKSAKLTAKLVATQQVRNESDKVEHVKTELAKAKAELAKIKEKMRGEQKEKVSSNVIVREDETLKNNSSSSVDAVKKAEQQTENQAVELKTDRIPDDYERLREKYRFIHATSTLKNNPSASESALGPVSGAKMETVHAGNNEDSKNVQSPASTFLKSNTQSNKKVINFRENEATEGHVDNNSSKETSIVKSSHMNEYERVNEEDVADKLKVADVKKEQNIDSKIDNISPQSNSELAKLQSHDGKPNSTEHSKSTGKEPQITFPKTLSYKEKVQTKQEILTSKIKAHAEKEISALKEKGFSLSKNSSKQLVGSQSFTVRQKPLSQDAPKKHEGAVSNYVSPKHPLESSDVKTELEFGRTTTQAVEKPSKTNPTANNIKTTESSEKKHAEVKSSMQNNEQASKIDQQKQQDNQREATKKQSDEVKDQPTSKAIIYKGFEDITQAVESKPLTIKNSERQETTYDDPKPPNTALGQTDLREADDSLQIMGIMVTVREGKPPQTVYERIDADERQMKFSKKEGNESELDRRHFSPGCEGNSGSKEINSVKAVKRQKSHSTLSESLAKAVESTSPEAPKETLSLEAKNINLARAAIEKTINPKQGNPTLLPKPVTQTDVMKGTRLIKTDVEKSEELTALGSSDFISNVVNTTTEGHSGSEMSSKKLTEKVDISVGLKCTNTDVQTASSSEESKQHSAKLFSNATLTSSSTEQENKHLPPDLQTDIRDSSHGDDNLHIDSIAVRVVPAVTDNNKRNIVEKPLIADFPSSASFAAEKQQTAASSSKANDEQCSEDVSSASSEDRMKETLENNLTVQQVLSSVRKLSDLLKMNNKVSNLNVVSETAEAKAETNVELKELDYFQVQGQVETNNEAQNNCTTVETTAKKSELQDASPNKTASTEDSPKDGKSEVFVFSVDHCLKKEDLMSENPQDDSIKRNKLEVVDIPASKVNTSSFEPCNNEGKDNVGQANHIWKNPSENPCSLSSTDKENSRPFPWTKAEKVTTKPDVKPKPKDKTSTIPEISAIADYARLKVIVSEDRELNTAEDFPPSKKEGFFPLIRSHHSRRPVFTTDSQGSSVKEKSLSTKSDVSAKVSKEPKATIFPITEREHQRTGMFKLGDKDKQEKMLLETDRMLLAQTKQASEVETREIHQKTGQPNSSSVVSELTSKELTYLDKNLPSQAALGERHHTKENTTYLRKDESPENQQNININVKGGRADQLKKERLANQEDDNKMKKLEKGKQLEEELMARVDNRKNNVRIKHIIEESRISLAEEERRAAQREEEKRAKEREAVAQMIKERREQQRQADKKTEEERKTTRTEDNITDPNTKDFQTKTKDQIRITEQEKCGFGHQEQLRRTATEQQWRNTQENQQGSAAREQLVDQQIKRESDTQEKQIIQGKQRQVEQQQRRSAKEKDNRRAMEEHQKELVQTERQKIPAEEQQRRFFHEKQLRKAAEEQQIRHAKEEKQRKIFEEQQRQTTTEELLRRSTEKQQWRTAQEEQQKRITEEEGIRLDQDGQRKRRSEEEQQRQPAQKGEQKGELDVQQRRHVLEGQKRRAEEDKQRKLFQEEQQRKAAEEQQRKHFKEEIQRKAAEEQQRNIFQEEQQRKAAEEQQRKVFQEEQQRKAAEEQQRKLFQEEQQRKAAEEQQRKLFQEEHQRKAAEEQQRKLFKEEEQRKAAEEQQRKLFKEEHQRKAAEEQQRKLFKEEQQRKAAEEQQRKLFKEEQQRKAAEEQQKKLFKEEEQRKAAEEQQRKLFKEEQQRKAAEEQQRKLFKEEEQRKAAEEHQRKLFQEEHQRKAAEEQQKKLFKEEEQRKAAEEQQRKLFKEEQQRKAAEEQQRKLFQEEHQRKAAEEQKQRRAENEQQIRRLQEKQQRNAAEEHQKITIEGRQAKCFQEEQERGAAKGQEKTIALEDKQHRTIEKKQITPHEEQQNELAKGEDLSRVAEQNHESAFSKKVYKKEPTPEQEKEEQQIEKLRRRRSLNHTLMKTKEEGVMAVDEKEITLKPEEKLVQNQSANPSEEKRIAGHLIQEKSKKKEENLVINRGMTGVTQAEIQKQTQKMDGLQYYAFTSTDMEVKSREKQLFSLLRSEQRSSPVRLDSPDDSIFQTKSHRPLAPASPAPSLPRSNTSSPALGTKPSMFKVKDNTIRSSSFIKSVKPRFHKNFGDDFLMASPLDRSLEKVGDERERIQSGAGTPVHTEIGTKQFPANTEFSTLLSSSAQDYSFSHHRPYSRRSIALDDDESRSVISNLSEDVESYATSAADVGDVRSLLDSERPESACSFSSDVSRSLGKPPVVPPKTEKALRRAQRLTSRRMKKELSKVGTGYDKETSSVPSSSSTETHQSNNDAVASPHFSQPVSLAHAPVLGSTLPSSSSELQPVLRSFHSSPHATGPVSVPILPNATSSVSLPTVSPHTPGTDSQPAAPKTVPNAPSSSTLHHANHPTPVAQYHVESSCFSQSYPMTQRKVLQDLGSGQYYVVDVPVQVQTKTFFDPETGKYVQLNVRESGQSISRPHTQQTRLHQTKLQPQPFTQTPAAGKPFVLYQRYHSYPQNYQPTAITPVRRSRSSAPGSLQQNHESLSQSQSYGNMANEVEQNSVEPCYSPERTPYMDTVIDKDKTHNSVKSTQNPMESASECGTKNQTDNHETSFQYQGRDIITMSELEDFMEATEW